MNDFGSRLIDAYLDGNLTSEQGDALQKLLRRDPDARATLRRRAAIDERITDLAASGSVESAPDSNNEVELASPPPTPVMRTHRSRMQLIIPWSIAAALAVGILVDRASHNREGSDRKRSDTFIGLLVDEAGARFEEGFEPSAVKLDRGEYRLAEGAIHLRLSNGADLVMKSPVGFRIDDAFRLTLQKGSLSAFVPPSAKGFTVAAPGIDYEDLGTEFAVSVDPASGHSELHVFDGQVDARSPDTDQLISSVRGGESVAYAEGTLQQATEPAEDRFLARGAIGHLRWQQESKELIDDPDLIGFYPFLQSEMLENHAPSQLVSDGEIHGARWVSGRWPDKSALLFDRRTDFVEINIPGEFNEMSFTVWAKLDRLENTLNSILNSNGRDPGDLHWEVTLEGTQILVRRFETPRVSRNDQLTVPMGRWVHLAGTISTETGESRVYLNGDLAGFETGPLASFVPGLCRLGNWLSDKGEPQRGLSGRIDEFAVWKRVLTPNEVKRLADAGKPNSLWLVDSDPTDSAEPLGP
ncbi:MAG: LamG-like jellyroll fold domain-containing protein [Planctomycetota bacterium]